MIIPHLAYQSRQKQSLLVVRLNTTHASNTGLQNGSHHVTPPYTAHSTTFACMSPSAFIMMLATELLLTGVTIYLFAKVLKSGANKAV